MALGKLLKMSLIAVVTATSLYGYAQSVSSDGYFVLKSEEIQGGTKSNINANLNFKHTASITNTGGAAQAFITGEDHVGGEWRNITGQYNCQEWTPHVNTVNFGVKFTQRQECDVTRERKITVYNVWSNGNRTYKHEYKEQQSDGVENSRQATGAKHYITGQYTTHSGWSNSGSPYSCGSWSPNESTVSKGTRFTQNRSCKQKQSQIKKTFNRWTDGRTDLVRAETLYQHINISQSRTATGTKVVTCPSPTSHTSIVRNVMVAGSTSGNGGMICDIHTTTTTSYSIVNNKCVSSSRSSREERNCRMFGGGGACGNNGCGGGGGGGGGGG